MYLRILSILLTISMLVPISPTVAFATEGQSVTVGAFTLSTDDALGLVENTDYTYENGKLELNTDKVVIIANIDPNTPTSDRILSGEDNRDGSSKITLNGVNIEANSNFALYIMNESTITIAGNSVNKLSGKSGICASSPLTITGSGSLTASSSYETGGIDAPELLINGGKIIAIGSNEYMVGSAGIQGENITISGSAHVTATGGGSSAGIGSIGNMGAGKRETDITISDNATVVARGGEYAAGIGGGCNSGDTTVTISGGNISAVGGEDITGIGGGYGDKTVNITITGGQFAQGNMSVQTVCGVPVINDYYVADNSGNAEYPYMVELVTELTVTPDTLTMQKGKTQQFSAIGTSEAVTWSVTAVSGESKADNTTISTEGLLSVAENETASSLTVTATVGEDSATASVRVIEPYVTVSFDPGQGSGTADSIEVRKTDGSFIYTLPNLGSGDNEINFTPPSGLSFAGWFVGSELTATAEGEKIILTENVTLTANWANEPFLYLGGMGIDADSTTLIDGEKYSYIYDADTATGTLTLKGYSNKDSQQKDDSALIANFNLVLDLEENNELIGSSQIDKSFSSGILIIEGTLTIKGSGTLTTSGGEINDSNGIIADSLSIIGSRVIATASNGTLEQEDYGFPIDIDQNLSVTSGGSLILKNHTPNGSGLMNLNGDLKVDDNYVLKVGYDPDGTDAYEIKVSDFDNYTDLFSYAEIKPGTSGVSETTFYPVWVGGVQVTSDNADTIQEGVSYNEEKKELTLNNAHITAVNAEEGVALSSYICSAGVFYYNELTLALVGENTITGGSHDSYSWGICGYFIANGNDSSLGITGEDDATLDIAAADSGYESYGIEIENGDLTISGGKVTAKGGTANFSISMSDTPIGGSLLVSDAANTGDLKLIESGKEVSDYPYAMVYTPYTISGRVKGSDTGENGLASAMVQLKSNRGNIGNPVSTDDQGEYSIENVPQGSYTLEGSKDGYTTGAESVTVACTNVTGTAINLSKGNEVIITKQPTDITVAEGDTATFTVKATNAANYQWYCAASYNDIPQGGNGSIIDTAGKVSGATTDTLSLNNVTEKMDEEWIWCYISDENSKGVLSVQAKLTVTTEQAIKYSITVNSGTANATAAAGETVAITANTPPAGKQFKDWTVVGGGIMLTNPQSANTTFIMPSNAVELTANYEDIPDGVIPVTGITLNKNSLSLYHNTSPNTATIIATVAPDNATDKSVVWQSSNTGVAKVDASGHIEAVGNGTANITASTTGGAYTAICTVTVSTYTSGGGSSSGGGSRPSDTSITVATPSVDKANSPMQVKIMVTGKLDKNDNVEVDITNENIEDAYNKALEIAKENGYEYNGISLVLNVKIGNGLANSLTINLTNSVLDSIINKNIKNIIVALDNPDIMIDFDLTSLKEIRRQAKSDVTITATELDNSKLSVSGRNAIANRPAFDFKVNDSSGNQVSDFGAGSVSISIPYILGENENASNIQAVYVDDNGNVKWLKGSVYDGVEQRLYFRTSHFSTYGVGYKTTDIVFDDIESHWAKENIEFVVSRELFKGTSNTSFSPDTAMTRAMFVTVLGRLAEADVSEYTKSSFSDVEYDAYYMGYIEWATENGVVEGIGDGKFAPNQAITREQVAVIMANYSKMIGVILPSINAENTYEDNTLISSYAKDATKVMQIAGVIKGNDDNKFDPQGTATRAMISTVLRRFVEIMAIGDTVES